MRQGEKITIDSKEPVELQRESGTHAHTDTRTRAASFINQSDSFRNNAVHIPTMTFIMSGSKPRQYTGLETTLHYVCLEI